MIYLSNNMAVAAIVNRDRIRGFSRSLLGGLLMLLVVQAHAAPKVVVSVLPIHSLVSALMRDVGDPQLLLPAGQSPHASQLNHLRSVRWKRRI